MPTTKIKQSQIDVEGFEADTVDGYHASRTPPNSIDSPDKSVAVVTGSTGVIDPAFLNQEAIVMDINGLSIVNAIIFGGL